MEFENIDYKEVLSKSMANIHTNLQLVEILKNTDKILCPESALNLAEIYFELKVGGNHILQNNENIDSAIISDAINSIAYNLELIEEIADLDLKNNGGNLKMCMDAIENHKKLDFSDFREKADMIHLRFRDFDEKKSILKRICEI